MPSDEFLKELSPDQTELALRIFDLVITKVLKKAYVNFNEETKENMNIVFESDNDRDKEDFIKKHIPNFKEQFKEEIKNIEHNIKIEIEKNF